MLDNKVSQQEEKKEATRKRQEKLRLQFYIAFAECQHRTVLYLLQNNLENIQGWIGGEVEMKNLPSNNNLKEFKSPSLKIKNFPK